MNIAITGGSGFLGHEVVSAVINSQDTPILLGRNQVNANCESRVTDYSTTSLIQALNGVDAVIHLAAKRGANGKLSDFDENILITYNLYNACVELGIKNVIFASSISVYSDVNLIPWTESQIATPNNLYGISKITCENIGSLFSNEFGLKIKNLRIGHIFGANEKNGYMINTFINNAFNKNQLFVKGKSIAKREFVYVKDVARAMLIALNKEDVHDTFNVGGGTAYTNYEIAEMVNAVFNNEGNLAYEPNCDEGISSSLMDATYANTVLGYSPKWSFFEALEDIKSIKS